MNPNNVYSNEVYTIRGDMCYDNKIMLNTSAPSLRQHPQHVVNVPDNEEHAKCEQRLRSRFRAPFIFNICIVIVVSALTLYLEFGAPPQSPQGFYCKDPSLSFPFRGDSITFTTIIVVTFLAPLVLFGTVEFFREDTFWRVRARTAWLWSKEYLIVVAINLLLTEAIKVAFGEPRPHFFHSCVPDTGKDCQSGDYVDEYKCTNAGVSRYFLADTSRSFPSGHASASTFTAIFFAAYIQQRFPTRKTGQLLRYTLITICLLWGCLCSLSRITDRRHHWWDVLAGMVLGGSCAVFALYLVRRNKRAKKPPRASPSTTTLLDEKNKDATSIAI